MIHKKSSAVFIFLSLILTLIIFIPLASGLTAADEERASAPFQYSGYCFPEYRSNRHWSEYVPVSDGTKLAALIYVPAQGPSSAESFPTIFSYTSGHREHMDTATGARIQRQQRLIDLLTSYGYAVVIAEMRGSGASFGSRFDRGPQIGKDGKDLVDWIASRAWCNGNVGMIGASYQGFSQFAVAGEKPAALKAIFPEVAGFDEFTGGLFYPGGIWNMAMTAVAPASIAKDDQNAVSPPFILPSAPVIDEDGDGDISDEVPVDRNGNGGFLDDGTPTYKDGSPRKDIYYNATLEHLKNVVLGPNLLPYAPYRDSEIGESGYSYIDLGPNNKPGRIAESGIAIYNVGGWFDYHIRCTTQWFSTLRGTNPSRMLLSPTAHSGGLSMPGPYWKYFGLSEDSNALDRERLRFFDRYLKGINNGIDKEPPVYIYVMNGGGWRFENEWPLARQRTVKYYFGAGNSLAELLKETGSDQYLVDYTTDSQQEGQNRWSLGLAMIPNVLVRTEKDLKCLTYTSGPLKSDLEVTGHPVVHMWVSSTASDGDFFVYLEDIDEKGDAYHVTDKMLRANFSNLIPNEDILPSGSGIDVLPDLPWHGFKKSDYVNGNLAGGKKVKLVIDLMPTSWAFKKGHRIRISIAGADWPTFQLHPALSPKNDPSDPVNITPTVTVYRSAVYPSHIELPVIPDSPTVFKGSAKVSASGLGYDGPAELYTFGSEVYLHLNDQWLKWKTVKHRQTISAWRYSCTGESGELSVSVTTKAPFNALGTGEGIYFEGKAP
jgi:uncharacterized protein